MNCATLKVPSFVTCSYTLFFLKCSMATKAHMVLLNKRQDIYMECEGMTSVGFYSSGVQSASFFFFLDFLHHCVGGQKTLRE